MRNPGRRRPLPGELTWPEREFYEELRRLTDIAGFSYRELEELTSSVKPAAGNSHFYSRSQWSRWINGRSRPPQNAVHHTHQPGNQPGENRAVRPVMLVVDDLQWADSASLALWGRLAGGQPDDGLLRLVYGAAGNPLYVTELVAALLRSSKVSVTGIGTATLTTASAPDSLAAIADRLGFVPGPWVRCCGRRP